MNKKRHLRTKRNFSMEGQLERAICGVEIYEVGDGKSEVVLCKPDKADYRGISTTNYFEDFASKIKHDLLNNKDHGQIKWFDRLEYDFPDSDVIEAEVKMDFDGYSYSNAQWLRTSTHA